MSVIVYSLSDLLRSSPKWPKININAGFKREINSNDSLVSHFNVCSLYSGLREAH